MLQFWKVVSTALGRMQRVVTAQILGAGAEGDTENSEGFPAAEVVHPLGFVSRPNLSVATEAVVIPVGDEFVVIATVQKGAGLLSASPSVDEGEARVYCPGHPERMVRVRGDGVIEIRGSAFADKAVARVDDSVSVGTLTGSNGGGPVAFVYTDANGTPQTSTTITISGKITSGAADVKA